MKRIENQKFQHLSNQEMNVISGGGKWVTHVQDVRTLKTCECENGTTWEVRHVSCFQLKYNNKGEVVGRRDD